MHPQIIILPEGYTEYYYFRGLESQLVSLRVYKPYLNLIKLMQKAQQAKHNQVARRPDDAIEDEVWIVIDRDYQRGNEKADALFYETLKVAEESGICVAYSDDAFELWFLLHYEAVTKSMLAKDLLQRLKVHIPNYEKPARGICQKLMMHNKVHQAIKRADRILKTSKAGHLTTNPSTTAHLLVRKILDVSQ